MTRATANVVILGSTGSIGTSTLKVLSAQQTQLYHAQTSHKQVYGLFANSSVEKLVAQVVQFKPAYCGLFDATRSAELRSALQASTLTPAELSQITILSGEDEILSLIQSDSVDIIMGAIVGFAGVKTSLAALHAGKTLLLANKETLVACGHLIAHALATNPRAKLIPVDSEHNAIYQALNPEVQAQVCHCDLPSAGVSKILLTASGGPFLRKDLAEFAQIRVQDALKHPNWSMGAKVTIDSSTLMNKGLEFIEASVLYNCPASMINTVIHPQSIVHSGVEYVDRSLVVQMGPTDMCVPIAYALNYPYRDNSAIAPLELTSLSGLTFEAVDYQRYPNFQLAQQALQSGALYTCAMNAANEVVVTAFLEQRIGYLDIFKYNSLVLEQLAHQLQHELGVTSDTSLAAGKLLKDTPLTYNYEFMVQVDALARRLATSLIATK